MRHIKTFENNNDEPRIDDYVILNVKNLKFSDPDIDKHYRNIFTGNVYKIINYYSGSAYVIDFYDEHHPNGWTVYIEDILAFDKDKEIVKYKNNINKFNL